MKATRKLFAALMALVMVVALCAVTASAAEETKTLITAVTPTDPGNVAGGTLFCPLGFAGMKITVGPKDIKVTELSRWYTPESGLKHNFMIAAMDGSIVLEYGKCVLDVTPGTAEGFVYAPIADGGVTLSANTSYYIISDYWGDTDKFYSNGVATTTADASIDGICILNPNTNAYEFYPAAGIGWGPMDLKYSVVEPADDNNNTNQGSGSTGTTPPPTGDAISAVVALLAVSGTALIVLKKKF